MVYLLKMVDLSMAMLNNQMVPRENDGKTMEIGGSTQEMMEI